MGIKGARRFTRAEKVSFVERYRCGERPIDLAKELGIRPTLVHQWDQAMKRGGAAGLRPPGRPPSVDLSGDDDPVAAGTAAGGSGEASLLAAAQRRIAVLEQKIGQQSLELDFFREALRYLNQPQPVERPAGGSASTPSSGGRRDRKAS